MQIDAAYSNRKQVIKSIETNSVHIPAASAATAPDFYDRGNDNFRQVQTRFSGIALYKFNPDLNCYAKVAHGPVDGFDFGRDFGASDYGYAYEEDQIRLRTSCAYKVDTPGGNLGAFMGMSWIKSASTFKQKQNIYPPGPAAQWSTNDVQVTDSGTALGYTAGLSYFNDYYQARGTLKATTSARAKVEGTYAQTPSAGAPSSAHFSGERVLRPAELSLAIEKSFSPTWSLKGELGVKLWSRAKNTNRGFNSTDTFLDTNTHRNELLLKLTSTNNLSSRLMLRSSLAYGSGKTGGDTNGLAISQGDQVSANFSLRYDLREKVFLNAGATFMHSSGGTSTYTPQASVNRYIVTYGAENQLQGKLGLGYRF